MPVGVKHVKWTFQLGFEGKDAFISKASVLRMSDLTNLAAFGLARVVADDVLVLHAATI